MRLRSELQSQQKGETSESVLLELRSVKEVNEGLMQRLHEQDSEETSVKLSGVSDEMHTESASEVPAEASGEVSAERSTQSPSEVPAEIPIEIPTETSIGSSVEVPAEVPIKSSTQSPILLPLATPLPEQSASRKRETPLPPEMPPSKQSLVSTLTLPILKLRLRYAYKRYLPNKMRLLGPLFKKINNYTKSPQEIFMDLCQL